MFMNYRERFECLKLSEGFEFVNYANHQIKLRCKKCGCTWWKYDDFIRRSKHGKVVCSNCGLTCKYEAPEYEKRVPKPPYVKKGHHTQAVIEAREKRTAIQRQQGEELYRQKFEALGLDFTFLKREWSRPKDGRFWIRCNKCGTEFLRDRAILNGTLKSVHCKACGNGTILHSAFVDEVMDFYSDKHSVKETAETFGISEWQVNGWAKSRGVTNGRTLSEINREKAQKANALQKAQVRERWKNKAESLGFDFVEIDDHKLTVRCRDCGLVFNRSTSNLFKGRPLNCPECKAKEIKQRKALREAGRLKAEEERQIRKADQEAKREANQNARFNQICVCKVCGQEYTPRQYMDSCGLKLFSNPGYCSKACRVNWNKKKKKTKNRKKTHCKHYSRAKKLGLPVEKGVTLPKLYKRDNGICQICGMVCVYSNDWLSDLYPSMDHIIPLNNDPFKQGGHTWKNVQLAHRICNSNKRDYVGKEWHNGND